MALCLQSGLRKATSASAANQFKTCMRAMSTLKKTQLFELHEELGGKMVGFAGYSMPVQYKEGIVKSHLHTREAGKASLFDVSHMGQLRIDGKDRVKFLESILVGDIQSLAEGEGKLSLMTNEKAGILDDTVVTNQGSFLNMVVNAGNKDEDMKYMKAQLENFAGEASFTYMEDKALLALQGPGAATVLAQLCPAVDFTRLAFMTMVETSLKGVPVVVTRCGYTGEDGFEVSVPGDRAVEVAKYMLDFDEVLPAGLGARDSLRLEAGLCLHGHDIDSSTTPVEAALTWTIGKRRREEGGFPGHHIIMDQIQNKAFMKKRVGLEVQGAPAREGAEIITKDGEVVGKVTSGTMSPCLKKPIAMGYVNRGHFKIGTSLQVKVRNKLNDCKIVKMPFVPSNYYSVPE